MVSGLARDPSLALPQEWDPRDGGRQVEDNLVATEPCHSASCLCGTVKLGDIYGPLLDHLERTRDLHVFAYDWRRCLDETARLFEEFVAGVGEAAGGRAPQVVAHSMGCLVALSVLNRRPGIFHSVLLGAGAMSPNASGVKDLSLLGENNTIVRNSTMFTPRINLSNPSVLHFLAYPGERELYGKPTTVLFWDEEGLPVDGVDLHDVKTWKQHKIGVYHSESGVDAVDEATEAWLGAVLEKVHNFRRGLLPKNSGLDPGDCPPVAVLRGDHCATEFGYVVRQDGLDLREGIRYLRGDGKVTLEDALPPEDVPVCKVVTNGREHSDVLNDLVNVDALLNLLISERDGKKS